MSLRSNLLKGLFVVSLLTAQAVADRGDDTSYLSYYTYYKTHAGETVSDVAGKFGLAETSFLRMNPQFRNLREPFPEGSLVCVPKEDKQVAAVVKKAPEIKQEPEPETEAPSRKVSKKKKGSHKVKDTEEPSDEEWDKLAELATDDAPVAPVRVAAPAPPTSTFIGSDGEVTFIPAARPKVKAQPKVESRRRVQLASRKGKAIHKVLETCRSYMGTPYVWGGEQPGGFDCSGYVQYVFAKHGYNLPRTADIQFEVGKSVKRGEEKPGDLVFFETYAPGASHVGVYLGRGYFIHASSSRGVTVERLATDFFAQRYLGAKRQNF